MKPATQYLILGGAVVAVAVGYVTVSAVLAHAAQGAKGAATTVPGTQLPFSIPMIPTLPAQQAWNDYRTVVLTSSGHDIIGVNLETGKWRTFSPGESFVVSDQENQSLLTQKVKGNIFYANEEGAVARYWSPDL